MANPELLIARAYLRAGRSVVPIAPGCKAPSLLHPGTGEVIYIRWEAYQKRAATEQEIRRWFDVPDPMGIGIVAGPVSGVTLDDGAQAALEFLDFDDADTHEAFVELVIACGYGALLERLPSDRSPKGGTHYGYLCIEWAGNTILARRKGGVKSNGTDDVKILVETRG